MVRVKFIPPRPGEATPSEHESSYSDYEENYPTTQASSGVSGEAKGKELHMAVPKEQGGAGLEDRSANTQTSTPSTTVATSQDPAVQRPSQQKELKVSALESAVSELLLGAAPNPSSFAPPPSVSQDRVNNNITNTVSAAVSRRRTPPQAAKRDSSQIRQPQIAAQEAAAEEAHAPQTKNRRKRKVASMSPANSTAGESSIAPPKKRARATRKISETESTISERPSSSDARRESKFNIFEAIIQHPHLVFHFANFLEIEDLISIYAISKDFHNIVNTGLTTVIMAQAMSHAPSSARIFPFRCYSRLCITDPRVEMDQSRGQSRLVPSFRWLRMVCWRDQVAKNVMEMLMKEGLDLPWQCEDAIKKLWFLMDISDNQRRLGTIQNTKLWTATDLFYAVMFLVRVDMRCTDPLATRSYGGLRRLLMAQPSMSVLYRTLERTALTDHFQLLQAFLRWKYEPRDNSNQPIYGVPRSEIGRIQYEGYGAGGSQIKLQRPDELVIKECIRRELDIGEALIDMIVWPCCKTVPKESIFED